MASRRGDPPQVDAAKRASMSIVWSVVAGVAYLGLIGTALDALAQAVNLSSLANPSTNIALITIPQTKEHIAGPYASLATVAIAAIPVAILVGIGLGIASRIRPKIIALPILLFVAGLLGLIGALLLGYTQLFTANEGTQFAIAVGTIVVVAILVRLQRFIRRFYQRSPAVASVLVGVLLLVYFLLSGGTSISSVFLDNLNIWLALISFAIVLYSGFRLMRASRRLNKAS